MKDIFTSVILLAMIGLSQILQFFRSISDRLHRKAFNEIKTGKR